MARRLSVSNFHRSPFIGITTPRQAITTSPLEQDLVEPEVGMQRQASGTTVRRTFHLPLATMRFFGALEERSLCRRLNRYLACRSSQTAIRFLDRHSR